MNYIVTWLLGWGKDCPCWMVWKRILAPSDDNQIPQEKVRLSTSRLDQHF